jgi:hypothetical protein
MVLLKNCYKVISLVTIVTTNCYKLPSDISRSTLTPHFNDLYYEQLLKYSQELQKYHWMSISNLFFFYKNHY